MRRSFIPNIYRRERGDKVSSENLNNQNRDLYTDLSQMFGLELALHARNKINHTMIEAISSGLQRELRAQDLPKVNYTSTFIYPDELPKASISQFYGEITAGVSTTLSSILDETGKLREGYRINRSSDNLVFSKIPESVTETRPRDALERSELPYMVRIRGINEGVSIRMNIEAFAGFIELNTVEFIPFPFIGGTAIRDIDMIEQDGNLAVIDDPAGKVFNFKDPAKNLYFPMRFFTQPRTITRMSVDVRTSLYTPSIDGVIGGISQLKLQRTIFEPVSYIGFTIPAQDGQRLTSVKPVLQDHNTFVGELSFEVYSDRAGFNQRLEASKITTFDKEGLGVPVNLDRDVFILVRIGAETNVSPQMLGFDYETSAIIGT